MIDDPELYSDKKPEDKTFFKKLLSGDLTRPLANFVKKHKILLSVTTAIIVILTLLFIFIPVISFSDTKLVSLGAEVRLEKGQTVKLKDGDAYAKIANFITDTCPVANTCYFEENAVIYEFSIKGAKYAIDSTSITAAKTTPIYNLKTISSDYKTYSIIKIVKKS